MNQRQLRKIAKQCGVRAWGPKAELIQRIRERQAEGEQGNPRLLLFRLLIFRIR